MAEILQKICKTECRHQKGLKTNLLGPVGHHCLTVGMSDWCGKPEEPDIVKRFPQTFEDHGTIAQGQCNPLNVPITLCLKVEQELNIHTNQVSSGLPRYPFWGSQSISLILCPPTRKPFSLTVRQPVVSVLGSSRDCCNCFREALSLLEVALLSALMASYSQRWKPVSRLVLPPHLVQCFFNGQWPQAN